MFGHENAKFFCVYRPYKESISKEMNDIDLNLHNMTKLSGWLRYWLLFKLSLLLVLLLFYQVLYFVWDYC